MSDRPQHLLDKAINLKDEGKADQAIKIYEEIIKLSADWGTPYYNLGLIYKYDLQWQLSFDYNQKATELSIDNDAAWWNLGIAATALKQWKTARQAWNKFDLNLDINDEEPNLNLGNTPIRLNPDADGEVVWCKRIDPARAIILNIPLPETNHRYYDMVLNDGAPQGYRVSNGKEYAVLNELQLLYRSNYKTYSCIVYTSDQQQIDKLEKICKEINIEFEDWSTIRFLCRQCSEGTPHEHHDTDLKDDDKQERSIGFAALSQNELTKALFDWHLFTLCEHSELTLELE